MVCMVLLAASSLTAVGAPFAIRVVDAETGRGAPLVELRTVNSQLLYTDSNGIVAFDEPGLMGERVFFHIRSHGYEYPADGFGYRGLALDVEPGGQATIELPRLNIAERLYRVTGGGIYRDTLLVGQQAPTAEPLLNARVFGQDSVLNAVYQGRLFWLWGDTSRPAYPLGNFHSAGATSKLPDGGGLDPGIGIDLDYWLDDKGFAREMARMEGDGPTWLTGLTVLLDADGSERMFASYAKIRAPLSVYRRGMAEFDDATERFVSLSEFPVDAPLYPNGHPFSHTEEGVEYVYYGDPYPLIRVEADTAHLLDLTSYEAYTPLAPGSTEVERAADGSVVRAWKQGATPVDPFDEAKLIEAGALSLEEAYFTLRDVETGDPVLLHRGTVNWNAYRQCWIMIACQFGGTSMLGEIWYSEANSPTGPWALARKVVTHDTYSFYNPKHHAMLDQDAGRLIYFEGTYTKEFSGNDVPTPLYDYNQIMYRLDLADPRLRLEAIE